MVKVLVERILACRPIFYYGQSVVYNTSQLKTYQHYKFHETFATHQNTDTETFSPDQFASSSSKGATNDLPRKCSRNNSNNVRPRNAIIKETKVRTQSGQSEIKREEEGRNEIFNLLGDFDSKTTVMRTN
jgi:hypothetical protein